MSVVVRPARLDTDGGCIIKLLSTHLNATYDRRRLEWVCCDNPEGLGRVWVSVDATTGEIVGTAAALSRRIYVDGEENTAWVFGDFCLNPQYRSLGPALQLQRACLNVLKTNEGAFCYDFPSPSMVAVYKRLGFAITGRMLRLAKLLRVDRKVREILKDPLARRAVIAVGNTLLNLAPTKVTADEFLEITVHHGLCGEEFTLLAEQQRGKFEICLQRSAEYLNWRYVNNPFATYEIITARRYGQLKGYAVWTQAREDASVVDLFGENNPAIVKALLAEVVARLTNCGVTTLSLWLNESHPWFSWCSEMGFRQRDAVPMVCVPGPALGKSVDLRSAKWFLMQGDRDG